ncbi:hypothetical protein BC829DRAFT_433025 [Chytridium lagenaria]|nr:hypothetical protein BC829DRAFT_433025 [Chytridium lagenaria]
MAEAGIHENLMQAGDGFAPNVDTSNDSDSDVDKAFEMLAARRDFTGGKSTWNTDPSAMAEDKRQGKGLHFVSSIFRQHHFIKSTGNSVDLDPELLETLGLGESDEASEEEGVPPSVTKSAARRARKTERKSERSAKRSQRKALEEEQSRIAKSIDFSDELLGSAPLPPMASALRRLVKEMCMHYRILPKTHGSGKKKVLLMVRTGTTRIPDNWKNVVETVVGRGTNGIVKGNTKMGPRPQPGALKKKKPPGAPDDRAAPRPGTIVGQNAAPIAADNVGTRCCWRWDGRREPLEVTVRHKRKGLGAD